MLSIGDLVDGRYEIEALIGQGGLAEVYRVRHVDLGGMHALKLLTWRRKSLAERLLLEGRIQAQLRHPNVVGVTDVIKHEGRFGLLMEYVDCVPLDTYIEEHGAFEVAEALPLFAMVMAGMAAAHDAGVLHRDLKPANILLARQGNGWTPKVTDFGIAKVVAEDVEASHSTAAGAMMGTPGYMAPEQVIDAADVDERADVFALGVILFELLTGQAPYADAAGVSDARSTAEQTAPKLSTRVAGIHPVIDDAVNTALARDRNDRFATVREFGDALFAHHPHLAGTLTSTQGGLALSLDAGSDTLQRLSESPRGTLAPPTGGAAENTYFPSDHPAPTGASPKSGNRVLQIGGAVVIAVGGLFVLFSLAVILWVLPQFVDNTSDSEEAVTAVEVPVPASAEETPQEPEQEPVMPPQQEPSAAQVVDRAQAIQPSQPTVQATPETDPEQPDEPAAAQEVTVTSVEDAGEDEGPTEEPGGDAVAEAQLPDSPEPKAEDTTPLLAGIWSGTASGRPLELRITTAKDGVLVGQAVFLFGPTQRITSFRGTYETSTGNVLLTADDNSVVFEGSGTSSRLTGTYRQGTGKKSFPWDVGR